jgi:hypothetical protein
LQLKASCSLRAKSSPSRLEEPGKRPRPTGGPISSKTGSSTEYISFGGGSGSFMELQASEVLAVGVLPAIFTLGRKMALCRVWRQSSRNQPQGAQRSERARWHTEISLYERANSIAGYLLHPPTPTNKKHKRSQVGLGETTWDFLLTQGCGRLLIVGSVAH